MAEHEKGCRCSLCWPRQTRAELLAAQGKRKRRSPLKKTQMSLLENIGSIDMHGAECQCQMCSFWRFYKAPLAKEDNEV